MPVLRQRFGRLDGEPVQRGLAGGVPLRGRVREHRPPAGTGKRRLSGLRRLLQRALRKQFGFGGWLAMTTSIFLCRWLGFAASFVLLTGFFIVVLERRTALRAFAIGVTLALAFHLLFVVALGVSLPAGPWGF